MKNYILIISILTIIIVFIAIYLSDYIKNIYFNNSILDFKEAFSIISKYHENYENRSELTSKYEELLNSRKVDFFNTTNTNYASAQELSLNTETEKFKKRMYDMYETINDPISDEFLPYTTKNYKEDPVAISNNNINEYSIINVYKNLLDRQPTDKELNKNLQDFYENDINEDILKLRIYNSSEYKIITNMQSNDIKPELITNISKGQLKEKIKQYYKDQHNTELVNTVLLDILIKCYIHLQFNDYLFKAMLMHDKYIQFENNLRDEYILNDEKILDLFNKNFILYELRLIANELKRQDILKRRAYTIPVSLYKNGQSELNSSNINIDTEKHISDIVKDGNSIFNVNIMLSDKKEDTCTPYLRDNTCLSPYDECESESIKQTYYSHDEKNNKYNPQNNINTSNMSFNRPPPHAFNNTQLASNTSNASLSSFNRLNTLSTSNISYNNILQGAINNGLYNQYNGQQQQQQQPQQPQQQQQQPQQPQCQQCQQCKQKQQCQQRPPCQQSGRIYNPIEYKQQYRGDMRYRPNVCSYGTKQIVQPVFLNSPILFHGTDLKEAAENTQVGSIMPKFNYYEYEDIVK